MKYPYFFNYLYYYLIREEAPIEASGDDRERAITTAVVDKQLLCIPSTSLTPNGLERFWT